MYTLYVQTYQRSNEAQLRQKENRSFKSDYNILSTWFDTKKIIFNLKFYLQTKGYAMGTI